MIREPVAKRYARALFQAARERDILDVVAGDLESLTALLAQQPAFRQFLTALQIRQEVRREVLSDVFRAHVHPLVLELLHLLLDKKRLAILGQIIEEYGNLLEAERGITRAQVTTALPLQGTEERILVEKLEKLSGHTILLEKRVDPKLLGGMMVRIGDRVIDRSVRRTLDQMRRELLSCPLFE